MTNDLFSVDASQAVNAPGGVTSEDLDALVSRGRQVHDDLLLSRARGQIGFADLYMLGREAMRARDAAEAFAGRFDHVAVLASGAEADVSLAVLDALAHPYHNLLTAPGRAGRPRVSVLESTDPDWLGAFFESFAIEQTLFAILGKTGDELGALLQFAVARETAKKRLGASYKDHLVIVTDPKGGTLRETILREGLQSFEVPGNVPARYGVLTPIGLFPAAVAGADVRGLLGGAHAAAERTAGEDLRTNPAYLLAASLHGLAVRGRRRHHFVAAADPLASTARHAARLFEESVGVAAGEPGARRTCESWSLPRSGVALTARLEATRDESAVVIFEIAKRSRDRTFPKDSPGLSWLGEKSLSAFNAADAQALRTHLRALEIPVLTIRLPALGANTVGALHMALMVSAAFGGTLAGGQPFGSPHGPGRDAREQILEDGFRAGS